MTRTRSSLAAKAAATLMAVVVLPTPPFWLVIARIFPKPPCYHVWRALQITGSFLRPYCPEFRLQAIDSWCQATSCGAGGHACAAFNRALATLYLL